MINLRLTHTKPQREIFFEQTAKYVIVPKGRRSGITLGGKNAYITYGLDHISPMLWVDTINGNIDRYFDRYFFPTLSQLPKSLWNWNSQKRELRINDSIIDFRSADKPESIEGFGYKKIFLNEAGIILKDDYLYTNAILPMLLDFSDSQLIAAGVPKGMHKRDGTPHIFHTLHDQAVNDTSGQYKALHYTTYDNPFIQIEQIKELESTLGLLGKQVVEQEIYGKFIEKSGDNSFFVQYDKDKHESTEAVFNPGRQLIIIVDFNLNPFAVNFAHLWNDSKGGHFHFFDEADIQHGSIPAMVDLIKLRYQAQLPSCRLTGDQTGNKGEISQVDNASNYIQLMRGLGINPRQLEVPTKNPLVTNSRADCNYALYHFPDIKFNPKQCPNTCRDMKIIQADAFGDLIKKDRKQIAQQGDHGDNFRYGVNTYLHTWIQWHQKTHNRPTNGVNKRVYTKEEMRLPLVV